MPSDTRYGLVTITQGRAKHIYANFTSDSDVDPATIEARIEFRTKPGNPAVALSFATAGAGSADGTITITQIAARPDINRWTYQADCYVPDTATQGLTPTTDSTTGALQFGYVGDLKCWAPSVDSGAAQGCGRFQLLIEQEITA